MIKEEANIGQGEFLNCEKCGAKIQTTKWAWNGENYEQEKEKYCERCNRITFLRVVQPIGGERNA
jgi:hypothetical protein